MKSSGSRRRYLINDRYADERRMGKKNTPLDMLPQRESIKSTRQVYNGKINFGLLVRFLRGQAGRDWNEVHAEIISRIPTQLLDYKGIIFRFVADQVEINGTEIWNKRTQRTIWRGGPFYASKEVTEFYVDPVTNILIRLPDVPRNQ